MKNRTIEITADDGFRLSAYLVEPEGKPRGAMIVVQEIFGVNSHIRSVCERYAEQGYVAIAPAMYDRYERGFEVGYTADDIAVGRALKDKADVNLAMRDVAAARDAVAAFGKVGIVGYCWGGYVAWMAASRVEGLACAVPYYGGGVTSAIGEKPKCPVLAHFGERDSMIPLEGVERLQAAHPEVEVRTYPADHGFNCDQRGSYDAASAKLAFERTLEFLRKHIG